MGMEYKDMDIRGAQKLELGRYRYFKSVSVFGIFLVFFKVRYSVSVLQNTTVSVSVFSNSYFIQNLLTENIDFVVIGVVI